MHLNAPIFCREKRRDLFIPPLNVVGQALDWNGSTRSKLLSFCFRCFRAIPMNGSLPYLQAQSMKSMPESWLAANIQSSKTEISLRFSVERPIFLLLDDFLWETPFLDWEVRKSEKLLPPMDDLEPISVSAKLNLQKKISRI